MPQVILCNRSEVCEVCGLCKEHCIRHTLRQPRQFVSEDSHCPSFYSYDRKGDTHMYGRADLGPPLTKD